MKNTALILLIMMCMVSSSTAQTIIMPYNRSRIDTLHAGNVYTLLDPGGTATYPNSCSSRLVLVSDSGTAITVSGALHTEYGYDFLDIYDGNAVNGFHKGTYSGLQAVNDTARTGVVTLMMSTNSAINFNGFSFTVSVCPLSEASVRGDTVTELTASSVTLGWNAGLFSSWRVYYGPTPYQMNDFVATGTPSVVLSNLSSHTTYYYSIVANSNAGNSDSEEWASPQTDPCVALLRKLRTSCPEPMTGCIDYSNLASCYVSGTYGTINNPRQYMGIVDLGSDSILSRHTVHTDTSETDPRTGNMLHTIPSGHTASVRLGNWGVGAQAESITYEYRVDTTLNDLLIMKYAALLQVPNHTAAQRPRFSFQIIDENGEEINSDCYSADFIASSDLGWNSYDPYASSSPNHLTDKAVLWKDWTTVGIDLDPLHGETIFIRLSTYDCAHSEHYGYAYFLFDCGHKTLTSENCGCQVENTFTAPEGFNYRWYRMGGDGTDPQSGESVTLSTERSLHVTQAGEYRCQLSFVGAPADASCAFEMKAIAGERYPAAIIGWDSIRSECNTLIALRDISVIASDSARQQLTNLPCEQRKWIVDGEAYSSSINSSVSLQPGAHIIKLVASLAGSSCTDTATLELTIPDYSSDTTILDTIVENQLPYIWNGHTFTETTANYQSSTLNALGCDSTIHYSLFVWPNIQTIIDSTICDSELPLTWNGHLFSQTPGVTHGGTSTTSYQLSTINSHGADSIVTMTLHIKHSSDTNILDTIVENQLPYTFVFQDSSFMFQETVTNHVLSGLNSVGCDSTIHYSLFIWPNIHIDLDSTICDSQLPLTWNGHVFSWDEVQSQGGTSTVNYQVSTIDSHGADSTVTMTLYIKATSDTTVTDTIVENQLPHLWNGQTFTASTANYQILTTNSQGCDSTIHYSLHVWPNIFVTIDSIICDSQLPFSWNGHLFPWNDAIAQGEPYVVTHQLLTVNCHGADSTVTLNLTVNPTHDLHFADTICADQIPYTWKGHTFSGDSSTFHYRLSTFNSYSCDSTVTLSLKVNPVNDTSLFDTICDDQLPYSWNGYTFIGDSPMFDHQYSVFNIYGCDSTIHLHLVVNPTHHDYHRAVVCDGAPYRWIDGNIYTYSTYDPKIFYTNIYGCDSVLHLLLDLDNNFKASLELAPDVVDLANPDVRLRDRSESHSREWLVMEIGDVGNSLLVDTARICTFRFPIDKDSLQVMLVARTMAGCVDTVSGIVRCDRAHFWVPNAFTPDEQQNNLFFIVSDQLATAEMWIYNRQGLLVTHFDALSGSWDGTYRSIPCPQDSYTWVMKYSTTAQPRQSRNAKGSVTLIR